MRKSFSVKVFGFKIKGRRRKTEDMYREYCLKKLPTEVLQIKLSRPTPNNSAGRKKVVQGKSKSEDELSLYLSPSEEDFFDDNKKPRFEDILTDMQSRIILNVGGS